MLKDSHQLGLEWEAVNGARALELNDMLDACEDLYAKRRLFQTFTKDERNGLMPEYMRRSADRQVPVGALVKPAGVGGIHFTATRGPGHTLHGTHVGLALVIGSPEHGSHTRYVLLIDAWRNKEGDVVYFAQASTGDMEVVE